MDENDDECIDMDLESERIAMLLERRDDVSHFPVVVPLPEKDECVAYLRFLRLELAETGLIIRTTEKEDYVVIGQDMDEVNVGLSNASTYSTNQ